MPSSLAPRLGRPRAATFATAALAGLLALGLGACLGNTGTISVSVVTAPESPLRASVERVRLTLTNPRTLVEATRRDGAFSLALEASASGDPASVFVEAFDADGELVAVGRSPDFVVGPIDARLAIYLAPPESFAEAPVHLAAARAELGAAGLRYGTLLVGGRDRGGAPRGEIEIYNAYDHTLARGLDLPAPRAGAAVAATSDGRAFIVGGFGPDGAAQATAWRFDTNLAPAGAFAELPSAAAPRAGERALQTSDSSFVLTGPPARIDVAAGSVVAGAGAELPSAAAAVAKAQLVTVVAAGAAVRRYRDGVVDELEIPQARRVGHALVATQDDHIAVIGGELDSALTADVVKIDPDSGAATVIPGVLETPRRRAAVARTRGLIVVAGGVGGSGLVLDTAELLDATTLAHVATVPMTARADASLEHLPNDQLLLVGGFDDRGLPTARLELFTPRLPVLADLLGAAAPASEAP
ncbi:MAG: hypothetical protein R3B48_03390 [Kofleriaceae bacterium]